VAHLRAMVFGIPVRPHGPCEYCPGGVQHEELSRAAERLSGEMPLLDEAPVPGSQ
jgi:hypothetical protein